MHFIRRNWSSPQVQRQQMEGLTVQTNASHPDLVRLFGINSETVVPGAGQIDGPGYSMAVAVQGFWCGDSWNHIACREFSSREEAEVHLAANLDLMIKRAKKQFGTGRNT